MTLGYEPIEAAKCAHLSGPSKWWMAELNRSGKLRERMDAMDAPTPVTPFIELTEENYASEQKRKTFAKKLGYQKLVGG